MTIRFMPYVLLFGLAACGGGGGGSGGAGTGPANVGPENGGPGGGGTNTTYLARKWNEGFLLSNPVHNAANPTVKVSGSGIVYSAWIESVPADGRQHLFVAVFNPASVSSRDDLLIEQFDNASQSVDRNIRWNFSLSEQEQFRGGPQLAVSDDGTAHLAWTLSEGSQHSVWVSTYASQSNAWTAPEKLSEDGADCKELSIQSLAGGATLLAWKQNDAAVTALHGALFVSNGSGWSDPAEIASSVKDGTAISVWQHGFSTYLGFIQPVDAANDRAVVLSLDLSGGLVPQESVIDSSGLKTNIVGTGAGNSNFVFWSERDAGNYYSVIGMKAEAGVWAALPAAESDPQDVGHLNAGVIGEEVHLVWKHRYSDANSTYLFDDLRTTRYRNGSFSQVETLFDSGAANPVLLNGSDGKLYLEWFTSHSTYAEYVPEQGWKAASRPFCYNDLVGTSGNCYNSGTEHGLSINKEVGAAIWLRQESGIKQVVVALSP